MSEEVNTTPAVKLAAAALAEPAPAGITLPDDAAPAGQLTASDRLLAFSEAGDPVTATAGQISDYVQGQTPQRTYRNLCCNSRGDNLNSWGAWSNADRIEIDITKFGRSVIKLTKAPTEGIAWWAGLLADENIPELRQYIGTSVPLPRPVTVAYDMWCNYAVEVRAWDESPDAVKVAANKFQRVKHTIPAGTILGNIGMGVILIDGKPDLEAYYENVQVEWGPEATPYCYNSTLPMSMAEQLVPGEFWPNRHGIKSQVYTRMIMDAVPSAKPWILIANGISTMPELPTINVVYRTNEFWTEVHTTGYIQEGSFRVNIDDVHIGRTAIIKVKYTKE